jgi:hypothetical protein
MDQKMYALPPSHLGFVLAAFREEGRPVATSHPDAMPGWDKAAQYACWYLSSLGLVNQSHGLGSEVVIGELGKAVLQSNEVRLRYLPAFQQSLP